jgi:hypothetical protein
MTENPVRPLARLFQEAREQPASEGGPYKGKKRADRSSDAYLVVVFLCCAASLSGGCSVRKRPSIPWAAAVQVRPVTPAQAPEANNAAEDALPELRLELPASPNHLIIVRGAPPRPPVKTAPSVGSGNDAEKLEPPTIAPPFTPQELAAAQQQTNQSLGIAEKNLALARGKNLNAVQTDLVSKIKGFIKDAREAAQGTDWIRARSLAKKAQVLAEELADSL